MFEFKITLNENDYVLFNQYHLMNSPQGKKSVRSFRLIIPILWLMITAMLFSKGYDFIQLIGFITFTIILFMLLLFSKKILLVNIKNKIKKMRKNGIIPYNKEYILKFDDECMHEITPNAESETNYSLIENIAVTEKAIYIYFSSVQAYLLPITAFSEETEKLKFLEFINSKVSTSDQLTSSEC